MSSHDAFYMSLPADAQIECGAEGDYTIHGGRNGAALGRLTTEVVASLERMINGGERQDRLKSRVQEVGGKHGTQIWNDCICRLDEAGMLTRTVRAFDEVLAIMQPTASPFAPADDRVADDRMYVLSRFAYMRRAGDHLVLETPLAAARIKLPDRRTVGLVHELGRPRTVSQIEQQHPELSADTARTLLELLLAGRFVDNVDGDGAECVELDKRLEGWEFHDLLFHTRSRAGRHDQPMGATFRFAGLGEPPPALRPARSTEFVELYRPDVDRLEREDAPFTRVLESRRSVREFADEPISIQALGEFLYRVDRVADLRADRIQTPTGPVDMEFALRPYPGGGALHELELYVAVNRCAGLATGLYAYDPLHHQLNRISGDTPDVTRLLDDASHATRSRRDRLQILIVIAARFQRVSWKYSSMAYNLVLKDAGVLYQTMYLVATSMGLGPCGVGFGNSDLFARAAQTDYYAETSVGEFLLGTKQ